ncbi:recombinase [Escherichia coli]|nr:recombinase [Escherichia coli]
MDLNKFDEPFSPEDIEWRIQQSGKTRDGKVWAMVLAYVTNRAIMKRLDDVCGKAGWRNEYRDIPNNGGVECGISIKIDSEWVTKWDAAENTQVEAVKGGRSGAMKRAAVQWGIGRYLYNLEEGFAQTSLDKKQGWHRAKLKDGTGFYWLPPSLPGWAIQASDNKPSPTPEQVLKAFTDAAMQKNTVEELKQAFAKAWKMLEGTPEQHKAQDVYNIRRDELEGAAA